MKQTEYQLIDSGNFRKLEQVGPYTIVRPAAQAVWSPRLPAKTWNAADAEFQRTSEGKGRWKFRNRLPNQWLIHWGPVSLEMRCTDFGHLGFFPEHHQSLEDLQTFIEGSHKKKEPLKALNLFAHTGAVSLFLASHGVHVTHCDASRTSVDWARVNAKHSNLEDAKIRWIVEDVRKFVAREARRKAQYDIIILDPPSFGRGTKSEVWKIEEDLPRLMDELKAISVPNAYIKLSAHSAGYTPLALQNILRDHFPKHNGTQSGYEMIVSTKEKRPLPCGACAILQPKDA